jgi:TRAP-type C4-dicarboxylate transport system substrate-binding protein
MINIIPLFVNTGTMARLSAQEQVAVREAAVQAGKEILAVSIAEHERLKAELAKKGMTVISTENGLNLDAFKSRVSAHVKKKFSNWSPIIESIQSIR